MKRGCIVKVYLQDVDTLFCIISLGMDLPMLIILIMYNNFWKELCVIQKKRGCYGL